MSDEKTPTSSSCGGGITNNFHLKATGVVSRPETENDEILKLPRVIKVQRSSQQVFSHKPQIKAKFTNLNLKLNKLLVEANSAKLIQADDIYTGQKTLSPKEESSTVSSQSPSKMAEGFSLWNKSPSKSKPLIGRQTLTLFLF